MTYRFGSFVLDAHRRELRRTGREVPLPPRIFALLLFLVEQRDRVVRKEELLETLWPDATVTESSLQRAVSLFRTTLETDGRSDAIKTHTGHGYRFVEPVEADGAPAPEAASPELAAARRAYEAMQWTDARDRLSEIDRREGLGGSDLVRLAGATQASRGDLDAVEPYRRALAASEAEGDGRAAARAAIQLATIQLDRRDTAVAQGWYRRAGRFLEDERECAELGWLAWIAGRLATVGGDFHKALRHALHAQDVARRDGDADLEALALLDAGHAHLSLRKGDTGPEFHEEAAALVLTGDVTPRTTGVVYCGVIYGARNRGDWRRAREWTDQFTQWSDAHYPCMFPPLCRLHRAEILHWQGALTDAEREVADACAMLADAAPWAEGDAYRVLGELRLDRGDQPGAEEAFQQARQRGWDPQPGYAMLQMARGDVDAAVRSLELALQVTDWPSCQRHDFLLEHLVIAAATAGQLDSARAAAGELERSGASSSLSTSAALLARARGEIAFGEHRYRDAATQLREAERHWRDVDAPLRAGQQRLRLAQVLAADGERDGAEREVSAVADLAERLKAGGLQAACAKFEANLRR